MATGLFYNQNATGKSYEFTMVAGSLNVNDQTNEQRANAGVDASTGQCEFSGITGNHFACIVNQTHYNMNITDWPGQLAFKFILGTNFNPEDRR